MRDDQKRQLLALSAVLLAAFASLAAAPKDGSGETLEQKLQAAKVLEVALFSREASAEDWRKLDRLYEQLSVEYPREARVLNAHAQLLWSRHERERAMASWASAERLDPRNAVVLNHLAGGWLDLGDVKKSSAFAARAIASEPENPVYHFSLANISFLFRHELTDATHPDSEAVLQLALNHFATASRLAPQNADYSRAYAETFYSLAKPDWELALSAWQRFLEVTPQKDFAFSHMARVHLKLGQKEAARDCLRKIQDPGFETLKRRLEAQAAISTPSSVTP